MRLVVVSVWTVFFLVACDSSRPLPAAPTPISVPTYTVVGTVSTARNVPVAGATVAVLDDLLGQEVTASAITDSKGQYSISAATTFRPYGNPFVSASKPGYFTDVRRHTLSQEKPIDFELHVWGEQTPVGELVRGRIGDALCSGWGYGVDEGPGGDACKRFAVAVPSSGTLEVSVSATVFSFDVDILKPNGAFATNRRNSSLSPVHLKIPVDAGSTYQIRVAGDGITAREFELIAVLR